MRRAALLLLLASCAGQAGPDGSPGSPGASCSFTPDADGSVLVSCQDGSLAVVKRGARGPSGEDAPPGDPGANGAATRLEVAPGAVPGCSVLNAGRDRDGDGFLESDEITDSAAVCRPGPRCDDVVGDVTLAGPLRLIAFATAGCTSVAGTLELSDLGQEKSLARLHRLGSVGALSVHDNPFLRSVDLSIGGRLGSLTIQRNDTLTSIADLEGHITGIDGPVTIADNPHLSTCDVHRLLDGIGPENVKGPVTTSGNGEGPCSSR